MNDISARRRSEEESREARRAAEAALEDLRQAQSRLVQTEKLAALGSLVAGVAHEVNTPIGIALTTGTFLADSLERFAGQAASGQVRRADFEEFVAAQREAADLLVANVRRAVDLVQSFKRVAADQTSEARRRFDLRQCLDDLVFSLRPTWRKAGHRIEVDCPGGVVMDGYPGLLSQVLANLVVNSETHAWEPGQPGAIRIGVDRPDPGVVRITYRDDGRGIPAEHVGRVFEPFFTTRRGSGSTGLGLATVAA